MEDKEINLTSLMTKKNGAPNVCMGSWQKSHCHILHAKSLQDDTPFENGQLVQEVGPHSG